MLADEIKFRTPEEVAEKSQRLRKEWISFLIKDVAVYVLGFVLLLALIGYSFWVLFNRNASKEDRQLATTILASAASVVTGFVFGKSLK